MVPGPIGNSEGILNLLERSKAPKLLLHALLRAQLLIDFKTTDGRGLKIFLKFSSAIQIRRCGTSGQLGNSVAPTDRENFPRLFKLEIKFAALENEPGGMGGVQNANLRLILTLDFGTKAAWIKLVESGPNSKQSESLDLVTSKRLIVLPVSCPSDYTAGQPHCRRRREECFKRFIWRLCRRFIRCTRSRYFNGMTPRWCQCI